MPCLLNGAEHVEKKHTSSSRTGSGSGSGSTVGLGGRPRFRGAALDRCFSGTLRTSLADVLAPTQPTALRSAIRIFKSAA